MKKGKEKLKSLFIFLLGFLCSTGIIYASTLYTATEVSYDNKNSGTSNTNVQGALDELYNLSGKALPISVRSTAPTYTGKEGELVIISNQAESKYYISNNEPINPEANSIWIVEGTSGSYSVSSSNVSFPLVTVKRYINSAWVEVLSYIYQNGKWNLIITSYSGNNGKSYVFKDSSGNMIVYSGSSGVSSLSNAYYYSLDNGSNWNRVGGRIFYINSSASSGNDMFYVVATDSSGNNYMAGKNWVISDGETSFSASGTSIGYGKINTASLLARSYDANGLALTWLRSLRNSAYNGCFDWFVGVEAEYSLLNPGVSYWNSNSHVYTNLGNWSNCDYNHCASFYPFTKNVIPLRSF